MQKDTEIPVLPNRSDLCDVGVMRVTDAGWDRIQTKQFSLAIAGLVDEGKGCHEDTLLFVLFVYTAATLCSDADGVCDLEEYDMREFLDVNRNPLASIVAFAISASLESSQWVSPIVFRLRTGAEVKQLFLPITSVVSSKLFTL